MLNGRAAWIAAAALAIMALATLLSLAQGDVRIAPAELLAALWHADGSENAFIVRELRLPRIAVGLLVGAALGMAGAIVQAATRNPLGSPDLMGVSAGAALTIVAAHLLLELSTAGMVLIGTLGGALAAAVTVVIAWKSRLHPVHLTLAGMSVAVFCSSAIMVFLVAAANEANGLYFWLIGGLADRTAAHAAQLAPWVLGGLLLGMLFARQLNMLMLDDDSCQALGVPVLRWRLLTGLAAVMLTAASVAVAGPIAFVGLMVPHIVRLSAGPLAADHRVLLPLCALAGAAIVALADVAAKAQDIPVGILTVALGGPLFVYLIGKR
ncbi:FecCD family ABC transporter permease [Janthinobacterium rivuli]|uniref:FecCD family ABC transporter permease n=1 Tax=Janthinobacterium TaxID=29580 RepID=UPI00383B3B05